MKIPLALLKGAILGLVLIGAVYFLRECYEPISDTLTHIPDIIFRGYHPETLDDDFSILFVVGLSLRVYLCVCSQNVTKKSKSS